MDLKKPAKEEVAIVLDFLPNGYPLDPTPSHRRNPIIQAVGKSRFALLELIPKKEVFVQPYEEVYIGEGKRDKVHHIAGRLSPDKLTATARSELEFVIGEAIAKDEKQYVDFFNKAQPLTMRMHQLELLPGVGKKHMWEIIEAREEKPFESFDDIRARVRLLPDPRKVVIKRIMNEIMGEEKHHLFTD